MVIIKQSDFNKDLDNYLATRWDSEKTPRKKFNFGMFKRSTKVEEIPVKVEEEMVKIEEEMEELNEEELDEDYEVQRREGLLTKFFKLLRGSPKEFSEEDFENPELDEEIREVLKLSFIWLNKLPPQKMKEFKASGDFEVCKDLLIRYGIAKEKE